jgi:DNA polymerase (family 10)
MGYPIDHKSVIEACVKNNVVIEINSNPLRLDLDYTWIDYAINRGVKFSINPDAHTKKGFHDIRYGIQVSRKGLMAKENCINCLDVEDFLRNLRNNNPI